MRTPLGVILFVLLSGGWATSGAETPRLTAYERAQGWRFLFNGEDADSWHGYRQRKFPKNWTVENGELHATEGDALVTDEQFGDFELTFEWRVKTGGAACVYFRVSEDFADVNDIGLRLELAGEGVRCGGNGGLNEVWSEIRPAPGEWHRAKITVFGRRVDHVINGSQVLSYAIGGEEWKNGVAASRFAKNKEYGVLLEGPIALAGDGAAFRNIKIRVP